jgi:hypothetical protein
MANAAQSTPEYQKGPAADPTQEQLPQGEAQQLNEGVQAANEMKQKNEGSKLAKPGQPENQDNYQPQPVEYGQPDNSPAMPGNDAEQMLFGPTDRPMEPIHQGRVPLGYTRPPDDVVKVLPSLQEAAADPDAPEALKNMLRVVMYHLGKTGNA